jgi:hypothetical protein
MEIFLHDFTKTFLLKYCEISDATLLRFLSDTGLSEQEGPDFDISVNPISTTGADEVHHITTSPLPLDVHTFLGP